MFQNSDSRQIQSVQTAFRIVNTLQSLDGATITELATHLDLAKSTVHNYLATLEAMGYVRNKDGNYHLGLRFLTHGVAAKNRLKIQNIVNKTLSLLAEEISHPTWWIIEEFGRGIFLECDGSAYGEQLYGRVGKRSYLHTHAPGKSILAALPQEDVQSIIDYHGLPQQTVKTTTDPDELMDELTTIRDKGFATSNGESVLGIESIGAAFTDPIGRTNTIGVFGYSHDLTGGPQFDVLTDALTEAVSDLETALREGGNEHV